MRVDIIAGWMVPEEKIGTINIEKSGGKEIISIGLDNAWIHDHQDVFLDPDIMPYTGRQYVLNGKKMFGFLSDSSPDRWGRKLIQKKARLDGMTRNLNESDYLLGISDTLRYGGIRFREPETGMYFSSSENSVPPITKLRDLEYAARGYEFSSDKEKSRWLGQLFDPGSSLGGARPKANVADEAGQIWIAKFPSMNDAYDIGAWEMTEHLLAKACGIDVPDAKLMKLSQYGSTFLTKRFDRTADGSRIHMMSAMTLLSKEDGKTDGTGYLDIAAGIEQVCAQPEEDLRQLWKRIAFSILTSNRDDHLRNHGFVLFEDGWHLSPAYDLNPVPYADSLSLDIADGDNSKNIQSAINISEYFRISEKDARKYIRKAQNTILKSWKMFARGSGISEREMSDMYSAFSECTRDVRDVSDNFSKRNIEGNVFDR